MNFRRDSLAAYGCAVLITPAARKAGRSRLPRNLKPLNATHDTNERR